MESGDLDRALAAMDADPMFRLIQQRRELRSNGWLAYIGYTRDKAVSADAIEPTEARAAKLQAAIDVLRKKSATVLAAVGQDAK